MEFEWDPKKAAQNVRKHRISFAEAATVFGGPLRLDPAIHKAFPSEDAVNQALRLVLELRKVGR